MIITFLIARGEVGGNIGTAEYHILLFLENMQVLSPDSSGSLTHQSHDFRNNFFIPPPPFQVPPCPSEQSNKG